MCCVRDEAPVETVLIFCEKNYKNNGVYSEKTCPATALCESYTVSYDTTQRVTGILC